MLWLLCCTRKDKNVFLENIQSGATLVIAGNALCCIIVHFTKKKIESSCSFIVISDSFAEDKILKKYSH